MKKFFFASLLITLALPLAACQNNTDQPITTPPSEETPQTETPPSLEPSETETPQAATEIVIVGTDFKFEPSDLEFTSGENVKLTFKNDGNAPHNVVFEGTDIRTETIGAGEETTVEFTAPSTGTYGFICAVAGHKDAGMVGTMVTK